MRLHLGQRADAVAQRGRRLEVEIFARFLHLPAQALLNLAAAAGEEIVRLADQRRVIGRADTADAGRRAALDLILQAGTGAAGEDRVRAVAQPEGALQHRERLADRAGRGEGRSEEHTSELQSLMRISYAVFCLK